MRRTRLVALTVVPLTLLAGCQLHQSAGPGCTTDPGTVGGGTTVCVKPPPTEFNQLGQ